MQIHAFVNAEFVVGVGDATAVEPVLEHRQVGSGGRAQQLLVQSGTGLVTEGVGESEGVGG